MKGQIPWSWQKKEALQLRISIRLWWTNLGISKGRQFHLQLPKSRIGKRLNLCLLKKKIYCQSRITIRMFVLLLMLMQCKWIKFDWTLLNCSRNRRQLLETEKRGKKSDENLPLLKPCTKNQMRIRLVLIQTWYFPYHLKMFSKSTSNFSQKFKSQKSNKFQ